MSVTPQVASFVKDLYARSDVGPEGHDAYVDLYLPDATLVMDKVQFDGQAGVRKFREAGWEKVATRHHVCKGIFPSPSNPDEVMTYGTVDYGFKDGSKKDGIEFATRLVMDQSGKEIKIKFYQVYIVSGPGRARASERARRSFQSPASCLMKES
jgi:hypothetical protein